MMAAIGQPVALATMVRQQLPLLQSGIPVPDLSGPRDGRDMQGGVRRKALAQSRCRQGLAGGRIVGRDAAAVRNDGPAIATGIELPGVMGR